jgi:biotin carboxyl carrier protein
MHKESDLVRLMGEPRTCMVKRSLQLDGHFDVLSPGVGLYDMAPAAGTFVTAGSFVGYLTVLRRYFHLLVPEGHHGVVAHIQVQSRKQRVEYGQPLFTVSPQAETELMTEFTATGADVDVPDLDVPEGMLGIRSPTDGIFYRRPNPQSPAYVEEGKVVSHGAVLALVEVMKCFNPILYPGEPEFPAKARVAKILVNDATEVKHGSVLMIVEPA